MIILGAGMAGCLAGIMNPKAIILEGAESPPDNHNAVLRFRTDNVGKVAGIAFNKVRVNKSIYCDDKFYSVANPQLANLYSRKVTGKILPRSIWNLDPVERFVAPPDFHMMMLDMLHNRIKYGQEIFNINPVNMTSKAGVTYDRFKQPVISTIPMPLMVDMSPLDSGFVDSSGFVFYSIYTERWHVTSCDVHQTIYFPGKETSLYRATLTGGDLILEGSYQSELMIDYACEAFGIDLGDCKLVKSGEQKYGKIAPVNDVARKMFMFDLSQKLGIYSLGRFACWRNVLLDDVYEDVFKIRNMINKSPYDLRKEF
jgi:hypothetical protein